MTGPSSSEPDLCLKEAAAGSDSTRGRNNCEDDARTHASVQGSRLPSISAYRNVVELGRSHTRATSALEPYKLSDALLRYMVADSGGGA
jgi:hypothetical protein